MEAGAPRTHFLVYAKHILATRGWAQSPLAALCAVFLWWQALELVSSQTPTNNAGELWEIRNRVTKYTHTKVYTEHVK